MKPESQRDLLNAIRERYADAIADYQKGVSPQHVRDVRDLLGVIDVLERDRRRMVDIAMDADRPTYEIALRRIGDVLASVGMIPRDPEEQVREIVRMQEAGIKLPPLGEDVLPPKLTADEWAKTHLARIAPVRQSVADCIEALTAALEGHAAFTKFKDVYARRHGGDNQLNVLLSGLVAEQLIEWVDSESGRVDVTVVGKAFLAEADIVAKTPKPKSREPQRRQLRCEALVPAKHLDQGEFFRKRTGSTPYLKIGESSVRYHKLDPLKVYGVTLYGAITDLLPGTVVAKVCAEHALASEMGRTLPEDPDEPQDFEDEPEAIQRRVGRELAAVYDEMLRVSPIVGFLDLLAAWNEVGRHQQWAEVPDDRLRKLAAIALRAIIERTRGAG